MSGTSTAWCSETITAACVILEYFGSQFFFSAAVPNHWYSPCQLYGVHRLYLGRPSRSRGSSLVWTRRPGRSSRCHRSGRASIPCWRRTRCGRCSTDPLPGSPGDPERPGGTQTGPDKPKGRDLRRCRCCCPAGSSWKKEAAKHLNRSSQFTVPRAGGRGSVRVSWSPTNKSDKTESWVRLMTEFHGSHSRVNCLPLKGTVHPCGAAKNFITELNVKTQFCAVFKLIKSNILNSWWLRPHCFLRDLKE